LGDENIVIVLDCGSTNLRAIAVNRYGKLVSKAKRSNNTSVQPGSSNWRIWDLEDIWSKLSASLREITSEIPESRIRGIIVATWGVDGAPIQPDGSLAYPVISWQCDRTLETVEAVSRKLDPWRIHQISGNQTMSMNALYKLVWLREHCPGALEEKNKWLMMPGLIELRLGARPHIDTTSASTMMALSLGDRDWSEKLLELAGVDGGFFPDLVSPGEPVGEVSTEASRETGLRAGLPILAGGHDTQFAILASGAGEEEAALSSGTWEILAQRTREFTPTKDGFEGGMIWETDIFEGTWDPQLLMMGSAVLEWVKSTLFPEVPESEYEPLIREGSGVPPGSNETMLVPSFVRDSGPTRRYGTEGTMLGIDLRTGRGEVYRAAVEGLSFQLRYALEILCRSTGVRAREIRVVGGGSRNELWNQIRSDVTGLPVVVSSHSEATVLGAAITAFKGLGEFDTIDEGLESVEMEYSRYTPSDQETRYERLYDRYRSLPEMLEPFYREKDD